MISANNNSVSVERTPTPPPHWTKFLVAALGGATGWLPIHPLDVTKVRMQIDERALGEGQKATMFKAMRGVAREEGLLAFYSGLSAGLTRQLTYTTLRLGLYDFIREKAAARVDGELGLGTKMATGLLSGGIASAVCNPVEVALVRMQADGAQTNPALKRGYTNVVNAMYRVTKEEGGAALYTGVRATVVRGMVVSCVQFATYDHAKHLIGRHAHVNEGPVLHLSAALCSGLLYSIASLPMDVCKTRMQNQKTLVYTSIPQTLVHIAKNEGFLALWKGFLPYFSRCGGHTITMFLCKEQYQRLVKNHYAQKDWE